MKLFTPTLPALLLFSVNTPAAAAVKENLGKNVNSEYTDAHPCLSPDGKTLFFTSERISRSTMDDDIFFSSLLPDGNWSEARPIPELNNGNHNAVLYMSPDGNTIYLKGTYGKTPDPKGFSYSTRTASGWSEPQPLHIKTLDERDSYNSQALTVSADGKVLILCRDADLYVCFRESEYAWSKPEKLPATINSKTYEYTPFLAPDNKTLYFSSSGHGGEGENDLFKTVRLDDTWTNWSEPENLGGDFNTGIWESYFALSPDGQYAYFYSKQDGDGDIYRLALDKKDPIALSALAPVASSQPGVSIAVAKPLPLPYPEALYVPEADPGQSSSPDEKNQVSLNGTQVNLYPNPASDHVFIDLASFGSGEEISVTVYDMTGKIMTRLAFSGGGLEQLNTSGWAAGTYTVDVKTASFSASRLLIKQ
ncbi:MAG: T9SS type A sorting domain-containing protein [Bacteroidota bacterium]